MEQVRWLDEREKRAWVSLQYMKLRVDGELARRLSAASNLSYQDYHVLVALTGSPTGRMRSFELARTLGWEKSRLSHHVGRMEKRRLVGKEQCDDDRRGWFVFVTEQGRREIEAAAPDHVRDVRELFIDHLSVDQLDAVADISQTILGVLESEGGPLHG